MAGLVTERAVSPETRSEGLRTGVVIACGLLAAAIHLVMVTWMFWTPGFSLHQFKAYYANDQQSYLTIAVDFAHGDFRSVEPYTQTGSIYYPRAYYQTIGLLAHLTRSDPVVWWWVGSLGSQAVLAGTVGAACTAFTRRRWLLLLGPLALTAGVFGELRGTTWITHLHQHAVIWGPFAEFFAGNGATVAVAVVSLCLLVLVGVVSGRIAGRKALVLGLLVALVIGGTASVHAYTFLMGTYVVTYVVAFAGLLWRRGRGALVGAAVSIVLLVGLFVLGPRLADTASPLALLVLGLLPAAPGALLAIVHDRRILAGFVAIAVGAAPQVVLTALGVASGDAFLEYRQASSGLADLGVPLGTGLFHGALLLVALLLVLLAGLTARHVWWTAIALGATTAWVLLWTNDAWGASQEPYRLWLNGFTMLLPVAIVVGAWVQSELSLRWVRLAGAGFLVLAVLSLTDYLAFSRSPGVGDTIDYHTAQLDAVASATSRVPRDRGASLVLAGPCIDPNALKIRTGVAVAFENVGMAWATEHDALVALVPGMWPGRSPPADSAAGRGGGSEGRCPLRAHGQLLRRSGLPGPGVGAGALGVVPLLRGPHRPGAALAPSLIRAGTVRSVRTLIGAAGGSVCSGRSGLGANRFAGRAPGFLDWPAHSSCEASERQRCRAPTPSTTRSR